MRGFFHRCERIPRSQVVSELEPAGVCAQPGRQAGAGQGAGRGSRRAPGAAGLCRSSPAGSRARRPHHLARPPENFSERVPVPAVPRSRSGSARSPHTHRRGPGTARVSGEPRWRARSRCSAPPAASRALTAAARAVPPLRTGTGREPPLGSARFPLPTGRRGGRDPRPQSAAAAGVPLTSRAAAAAAPEECHPPSPPPPWCRSTPSTAAALQVSDRSC